MKTLWDGSLHGSGYGAPELRQVYQKYMSRSLVVSIALQAACAGVFYALRTPDDRGELPTVANFFSYRIHIPSSLFRTNNSSAALKSRKNIVAPRYAIPVPVKTPFVESDDTVQTQPQTGVEFGELGTGTIAGEGMGQVGALDDDTVAPPPFRAIEKEPKLVNSVEPYYPSAAIRAGIEGTVIVSVWVDKVGRVRKAIVVKSKSPILESPAREAAMHMVFTPAIMQHDPVSVWVAVPFHFKLSGK